MASINNIEYMNLREWAPLTDLFNKLPTKSTASFFAPDVKITCIDILPEYLALGTNVGIIYWYDRKKKDLQRLRCEKPNVQITAVKIISTVDFMVACGCKDGNINIFQIPKSHPDSIPDSLKPKNKQVERYTVNELHKSPITAIEWSKNGMKLFSGDKSGCIVLTEIDFYMHICKSVEILNEAYEVVQLSYNQQRLLVSTTYRSIICHKQDKWKVSQVGTKDRKVLGKFGGIIYQNGVKTNDLTLYCTRPGLRLWLADVDGNVQKTLLFKELLCKECPEVPIINPISRSMKLLKPYQEPSFGILLPFNDNLILTYNNDVIYILDPEKMTVIATMSHFRSVLGVSTYKDEIFVLEEERSIVRISYRPETVLDPSATPTTPTGSTFFPITTSIKDLTNKLQTSNIIPVITPLFNNQQSTDLNVHTDESLIMNAEEAKESPIKIRASNYDIEKKFNDIGKQQFSDKILYRENKKKKHSAMSMSVSSLSSNSSEEKELTYIRPTLMTLSSVGVLPDLRSPESIQSDIEYKEKILADVLNLDKIKIPLDKLQETGEMDSNNQEQNDSKINCDEITEVIATPVRNSKEKNKIKKIIPPTQQNVKVESNIKTESKLVQNEISCTPPALVNIPNDWKLSDIQIGKGKKSNSEIPKTTPKPELVAETSLNLNEWEIL